MKLSNFEHIYIKTAQSVAGQNHFANRRDNNKANFHYIITEWKKHRFCSTKSKKNLFCILMIEIWFIFHKKGNF